MALTNIWNIFTATKSSLFTSSRSPLPCFAYINLGQSLATSDRFHFQNLQQNLYLTKKTRFVAALFQPPRLWSRTKSPTKFRKESRTKPILFCRIRKRKNSSIWCLLQTSSNLKWVIIFNRNVRNVSLEHFSLWIN